ncbi:hypothetical protein D3C87_989700 [compost metagenome]
MVEHVNIIDSDRHEPKHASTALANQALVSNGNGTTSFKFYSYDDLINKPTFVGYQQVLSGFSTAASQSPAALDTPLQIEFGAGSATPSATLASNGTLTFNIAGDYIITLFLRFGRTAGAGTSITLNRFLINGVQGLNSNAVKLPDQDSVIPFSTSLNVSATAGMTFQLQIMRDSAGNNNGGLFRILPTVAGWNLCPSATIVVSKFVGVV